MNVLSSSWPWPPRSTKATDGLPGGPSGLLDEPYPGASMAFIRAKSGNDALERWLVRTAQLVHEPRFT